MSTINLIYFSWVREKIGKSREEITLPDGTSTIADLITLLESRGPEYRAAFENKDTINTAINQTHVDHQTTLDNANEVAFFPPITGG